uniref:RasGEF domain family member 1B n=1 Tax=Rousettus aegyptiacus TaxID=9407 RepID=A0A7J8E9Z9_ROUAE|nr:RasGEF domain family member 1B [Rousettus aegyptiacus]
MAKFLAELLGCTLPSKGASPMFETTVFSTLASEKSLSDCKKEQQWKTSMYSSVTPVCFTSPLIEKPIGKVRINSFLVKRYDLSLLAVFIFVLSSLSKIIK